MTPNNGTTLSTAATAATNIYCALCLDITLLTPVCYHSPSVDLVLSYL